ncbi:flagellar hook-associated protein FlgK [Jeotgalibacillus sp. R-1-5s-1]|uniref:flagellar hook-associated protein FlgK n=1 Tax=Jeotgalibacillus sp. R-1-5s-1 TaxID=2555897 RepID=UPI0010698544|nr:flagellar hook-associated protein FlgK [Jeotgalibacillus sp. R-1-5s-1]TFD95787.1 flagellar hook-associated protein FlgK [Jeotgalibacillus sp. R-1-5s-1]
MRATFQGLEAAKRAIFTQQSALYTTGHNIANANTPGFSRQRIDFKATDGFPTAAMNRPEMPGQVGTGVEAGAVQRYRDTFLDMQYRQQNTGLGYWSSQAQGLHRMEEVMNEPSDQGLSKVLDQFWSSLEDLSVNPEDAGARAVVLQRGQAVAETFNYLNDRLSVNKKDIGAQIDNTNFGVNGILRQIHALNQQIGDIEPNGYLPNDLYDQRDKLVDELSEHVSIRVSYTSSGGNSGGAAQGKATIELLDANLKPMAFLVDGKVDQVNQVKVQMDDTKNHVVSVSVGSFAANGNFNAERTFDMNQFTSQGSLLGHIHNFGYTTDTTDPTNQNVEVKGNYPEMLDEIDLIAFNFADAFNKVHRAGFSLEDITSGTKTNRDFFTGMNYLPPVDPMDPNEVPVIDPASLKGFAAAIKLSNQLSNNPERIAAAAESEATPGVAFSGNGRNALEMARVKDAMMSFNGQQTSVSNYYQGVIGNMGVKTSEADRLGGNNLILLDSIQRNRDSVSSVSLDEEMTNMIKYQQAFNAASRNITVVDEMLDKIINGMGLVGR